MTHSRWRLQLAARATDVEIQRFAALDHQTQHLMHEIFAEGPERTICCRSGRAQLAQHAGGLRRRRERGAVVNSLSNNSSAPERRGMR